MKALSGIGLAVGELAMNKGVKGELDFEDRFGRVLKVFYTFYKGLGHTHFESPHQYEIGKILNGSGQDIKGEVVMKEKHEIEQQIYNKECL